MTAEQAATTVVQTLRDAGHIAYFAGGCVRDRLLGLPAKDFDVATDAKPDRVQKLFRKTQAVGAAFGVILVRLGGQMIEVATFRSDGKYEDGRRPETVTFDTAEADAQRRDFTINGLFYDPFEQKIIDYVGGQADLASKTLRAIGTPAERFAEDHLRLLRAVRFAARFGLTIEPETAAAMDAAAPCLPRISKERIAEELRRILASPTRNYAYRVLWEKGLTLALLPGAKKNLTPTDETSIVMNLAAGEEASFPLVWLATLLDLFKAVGDDPLGGLKPASTKAILSLAQWRLQLSNNELGAMTDIARWCDAILVDPKPDDARLKRFLARPTASQARQLLDAFSAVGVAVERIDALRPRLEKLALQDFAPTPLLNGDQLIAAGVKPGPAFKRVLEAVYDAQLNGEINDAAAALNLGLRLHGTPD